MKTLSKNEMRTAVESLIANGAVVKNYAKFARIQAIEAVGGEVIETILADGTKETSNTANAGDWIVTNPGGEKYIVPAAKFPKKYEAAPEIGDGWFKPTGGVQKFLELDEDQNSSVPGMKSSLLPKAVSLTFLTSATSTVSHAASSLTHTKNVTRRETFSTDFL